MFFSKRIIKRTIMNALALLLVFLATPAMGEEETAGNALFTSLERRLVQDGFDACLVECIFKNTQLTFDARGAGLYFVHNESVLDYESFANTTSIYLARQYMKKHRDLFDRVEQTYGVDKTMIAAIILVETGLGTFVGKRPVVGTLASMAAMSDPVVL